MKGGENLQEGRTKRKRKRKGEEERIRRKYDDRQQRSRDTKMRRSRPQQRVQCSSTRTMRVAWRGGWPVEPEKSDDEKQAG